MVVQQVESPRRVTLNFTLCRRIVGNVAQVVVGKSDAIELLMVALLADGHVLLEDVPGLGKTLVA